MTPTPLSTQDLLAEHWKSILAVDAVAAEDSFFDLGGSSLQIVNLLGAIQWQFGVTLPFHLLFENPTLAELAETIDAQRILQCEMPEASDSELQASLFFLWMGVALSPCLPDRRVYELALQKEHLDNGSSIESMARTHVEKIREIDPQGPYILGGYSANAVVALEVAQQLLLEQKKVLLLILLDPESNPVAAASDNNVHMATHRKWTLPYLVHRAGDHIRTVSKLSFKQIRAYLRDRRNVLLSRCSLCLPRFVPVSQRTLWYRAIRAYPVKKYTGRVVLIAAEQRSGPSPEGWPFSTWGTLVEGPFDVRFVPGNHKSMFVEPQLQVLHQHLRLCVERATALDSNYCVPQEHSMPDWESRPERG